MNAYSLDLRELVIAFVEEGHSQAEAARQFKLYSGTVSRWIKLKKTTSGLKVVSVPRSPHKLPLDDLEKYVKKHPDAFLREMASHFGCGKDAREL
ncbi:MAG: helix-turn-helix domain-containing protein [Alphaproteobacteria bacterium]|nr:helix-turn-helix domain-containing protein [Alphaproteobacteria bacterium]